MSGSKQPPHLPEIVDEAGETPRWVPWLGLALLGVFVLLLVARQVTSARDELPGTGEPAAAAEPAAAEPAAKGADEPGGAR